LGPFGDPPKGAKMGPPGRFLTKKADVFDQKGRFVVMTSFGARRGGNRPRCLLHVVQLDIFYF